MLPYPDQFMFNFYKELYLEVIEHLKVLFVYSSTQITRNIYTLDTFNSADTKKR